MQAIPEQEEAKKRQLDSREAGIFPILGGTNTTARGGEKPAKKGRNPHPWRHFWGRTIRFAKKNEKERIVKSREKSDPLKPLGQLVSEIR